MRLPTERDFAEFVAQFDFVLPLGGLFQPLPEERGPELWAAEAAITRHPVGRWLGSAAAFAKARRTLEARPFYKQARVGNRAVIRLRFLIDVGCALAEVGARNRHGVSIPSAAKRATAIKHTRALAALIEQGISLAAEGRTRTLYWALRDLSDELGLPPPVGSVRRRSETLVGRLLAQCLATRFLRSFGETLTGTLADLATLAQAEPLSRDAIKAIAAAARQRQAQARGTLFLSGARWREDGGS